LFIVIVVSFWFVSYASLGFRDRTLPVASAAEEARAMLIKAGGPDKIRDEAGAMFVRFGRGKIGFMSNELGEYPGISSLGIIDCIMPDSSDFPAYIKIRVRTHINGFMIAVCDPKNPRKPISNERLVEISRGIYVAN